MTNIEKRHIIDSHHLSSESYFLSILQEAYACRLLDDSDLENIQLQCIELLARKSEDYGRGKSSSIRVEAAESIMKSNLYTIGLYLKSLPDADCAAGELKTAKISEMYQEGRKIINVKFHAAKHIFALVQKNKLITRNETYNATLSDSGLGIFFESYDPEFEAHESPSSIDYQLCDPVMEPVGVEYIHQYLKNLFNENEFCGNFAAEDIHQLLCGYDEGYKDLLINIFEQVLTAAIGCSLANRSVPELNLSGGDIRRLQDELSKEDDRSIALKIRQATGRMMQELNVTSPSLRRYIEESLPKISSDVVHAVRINTLDKTFVSPAQPDLKHRIRFASGVKMADEEYRKFIDELSACRYSADRLALINEKAKSFGDLEDVMLDAQLSEEEITAVLSILGEVEIAALIRRHLFEAQAVDLSEAEQALRITLERYMDRLAGDKRIRILEIMNRLVED